MCTNVFILRKRCECIVNTVLFVNDILHGGCFYKTRELVILPEHGVHVVYRFWFSVLLGFNFVLVLCLVTNVACVSRLTINYYSYPLWFSLTLIVI